MISKMGRFAVSAYNIDDLSRLAVTAYNIDDLSWHIQTPTQTNRPRT